MPVTAGKGSQYSNISITSIFRFEGKPYTYYPGGMKAWSRQAAMKQEKIDGWNKTIKLIKEKVNN